MSVAIDKMISWCLVMYQLQHFGRYFIPYLPLPTSMININCINCFVIVVK